MDLKTIMTAWPFARRIWKWMPGPLRTLVVVAALVVVIRRLLDDEDEPAGETS